MSTNKDPAADSFEQNDSLQASDHIMLPPDYIQHDAESRARARARLEEQAVSVACDIILSDFAWTTTNVIPTLLASHPSGAAATKPLRELLSEHNGLAPSNEIPIEIMASLFPHLVRRPVVQATRSNKDQPRPDEPESNSSKRTRLQREITAKISSLLLADFSWAAANVFHTIIVSHPSGQIDTARLQQLLLRYNDLTPINAFPFELFANIFSFVVHDPDICTATANKQLGHLNAVCTRWRHSALSSAHLWSRIDLSQGDLAALSLQRALNSTLAIDIDRPLADTPEEQLSAMFAPILERAPRITEIRAKMQHGTPFEVLLARFPPALPLLHTLALETTTGDMHLLNEGVPISDNATLVTRSSMPALRHLKLARVPLPWTLPIFRGLTTLYVDGAVERTQPSVALFREVLAACPELETLTLIDSGPIASLAETVTPPPPVSLPHLREVKVANGPLRQEFQILFAVSQLALPRAANVTLSSFQPLPRLEQATHAFLRRFTTLRLRNGSLLFASPHAGDGTLNILTKIPMEDDWHLDFFLNLPCVHTVVLRAMDALEIGYDMRCLMKKLQAEGPVLLTSTRNHWGTFRTEGFPLAAVEKMLYKKEGFRMPDRLELVDVPRTDPRKDAEKEAALRKLVGELVVQFAETR
ncbi:hypothetical protein DENSPDRAFT_927875 [Dentipellis sp. KUC8613]|nr:hypothetical protein DENSPDRAFT_927875 [Dentipellis sp. KUC8613]